MGRFGIPRHLYKFRFPPDLKDDESKDRLKAILLRNELHAAHAESLNDPFDCTADYLVEKDSEELIDELKSFFISNGADAGLASALAQESGMDGPSVIEGSLREGHAKLRRQLRVCALSAEWENSVLWAHYGYEHKGLAIQFRPFMDPLAFQAFQVNYSDHYPKEKDYFSKDTRDLVAPLLQKASLWKYEKEWRLIKRAEVVRFRPNALASVVLGVRISDEHRQYIEGLVEERNRLHSVDTPVYRIEPLRGSYGMRTKRVS